MSYRVTGACVLAKDREGQTHHVYENGLISWLSDEQAKHLLDQKLVEEVDGAADDSPPAKTAPKADWVAFAVAKGADEAEAEGLTKQELQDLYGE